MLKLLPLAGLMFLAGCSSGDLSRRAVRQVEIFYKPLPPSEKTTRMVEALLKEYGAALEVKKYDILAPASVPLLKKYGLPETHFPFALLIDGSYSARLDGQAVDFVEFPLEMKGIGRHEGDWSLPQLRRALDRPELMLPLDTSRKWAPDAHSHDEGDAQ